MVDLKSCLLGDWLFVGRMKKGRLGGGGMDVYGDVFLGFFIRGGGHCRG